MALDEAGLSPPSARLSVGDDTPALLAASDWLSPVSARAARSKLGAVNVVLIELNQSKMNADRFTSVTFRQHQQ